MRLPLPLVRDLVLIGGGHTHALVLRRWGMAPLAGVRLTVISPDPTAPYTGMLPGHVAGHYPRAALEIDLVRLARFAGARLILGRVEGIDSVARRLLLPGRAPVAYDIASLDIGVTAEMPELPGFSTHAHPAKPLGPFAVAWERFVADVEGGRAAPKAIVIGGGVGGVELAMAMAHRLREAGTEPQVTVFEAGTQALRDIGTAARATLLRRMAALGVGLETGRQVARVTPGAVVLGDGRRVPAGFVIGAAGARPQPWLAATGLALEEGFVRVGPTLQTESDPTVFAVGDCAHLGFAPRPKAGVYAVRAAPVLCHNLRVALSGRGRMRAFRPQRDYLKLVSTGGRSAVADKFGLRAGGAWLWHLKDRIDRRFMAKFHDLPAMPAPDLPAARAEGLTEAAGTQPLCAGCGAKVGPDTLRAALAALPAPQRADVLSQPGDDAAVLAHGEGAQSLTTDHLRAFSGDLWLFARVAALHALGDVWAMGVRPQAALASITLPPMAPRLQTESLREILAAATEVFRAEGAELVGGHTTTGAEMQLGFTLTGLGTRVVALAGARPGDALLLTKPLGTGTILAAEMALAAPGRTVAAALACMAISQGAAARQLANVAHAMTDVTGFGLAGHLHAICRASSVGAELDLDAVPILEGAESLALAGVRSTLWPANMAAVEGILEAPATPRASLLADPQTAGGLLAAVPPDRADAICDTVRRTGLADAEIVGRLTEGPPTIRATGG